MGITYSVTPPHPASPTVLSISPVNGDYLGSTVTITGTNFVAGATVTIGGIAATSVTVVTPTQITATTGVATPALVGVLSNVVVTNPSILSGSATLFSAFTYTAWWQALSVGGTLPTFYADFTTQGGSNHYFYNGNPFSGFSAWLTANGGTFSRGSTAYSTNSSGTLTQSGNNAIRFDFDPIALTSKGVLLEGASTNIHLHSSISDSVGSYTHQDASDTLTANAAVAPDGTTTAAGFVPFTNSAQHNLFLTSGTTLAGATTYTYSIFAKANGFTNFQLDGDNIGTHFAQFTLSGSGSTSNVQAGCTATIAQLANGWYRCALIFPGTAGSQDPIIYTLGNGSSRTYAGDGVSGYFFWGEQIEVATAASSYIPTTNGSASRSADNLSVPWTATTFTAAVKTVQEVEVDGNVILDAGNGLLSQASGPLAETNNGTQTLTTSINALTTTNRVVVGGSPSGRVLSANGNAAASDANALVPGAPTVVQIGANTSDTSNSSGNYNVFGLWSIAFSGGQASSLSGTL